MRTFIAVVCLSSACALAAQGRFVAGVYEDPLLGFKVKVPDKWTSVPIDAGEKWLAAKFVCPRSYETKVGSIPWKPELRVVVFSPAKIKSAEAAAGADGGKVFHDYKEWLPANVPPGTMATFESEQSEAIADGTCTRHEITTSVNKQRVLRYVCCVFVRKADGLAIAVDCSQLDDYYKNLQADFDKSLKSFKFTEAAAAGAGAAEGADADLERPLWTHDRAKWRELPKAERWRIRQTLEGKRRARMLAQAPEGWTTLTSKSKRFTAIAHVDKRYAAARLDRAEATWDWLEETFGAVSDEYAMAGTIQLCKDWEEAAAHGAKNLPWEEYSSSNREIVDCKDTEALLPRALVVRYLLDKDPLASFCPTWFVYALASYLGSGEVDGKKLAFKGDAAEKATLKDAQRAGALRSVYQLISTTTDAMPSSGEADVRLRAQMSALLRFLESKESERFKGLAGFLPRYVTATIKAAEQWQQDHPAAAVEPEPAGQSDAQRAEAARNKMKAFLEREKFVSDSVLKEVVNLPQQEWLEIEAAFKKWLAR